MGHPVKSLLFYNNIRLYTLYCAIDVSLRISCSALRRELCEDQSETRSFVLLRTTQQQVRRVT